MTIVVASTSALLQKRPQWLTKLAFGMDTYRDVSVKSARRHLRQNALYQFVLAGIWFGTVTVICAHWLSVLSERLALNQIFPETQLARALANLKVDEMMLKIIHKEVTFSACQSQLVGIIELKDELFEAFQHDLVLFFFCPVVFATSITICALGVGIRCCQAAFAVAVSCASLLAFLVFKLRRQSDMELLVELALGFTVVVFMISWLCRLRDLELRRDFLTNNTDTTWLNRYHIAETGGAALRSVHRSATCCVYFAKDLRRGQTLQQSAWCGRLRHCLCSF